MPGKSSGLEMRDQSPKSTVSATETTPAASQRAVSTENSESCEPWLWATSCNAYKEVCAYCLKKHKRLRTCSRCEVHRYCSTGCQAADWKKEHKTECKVLKDFMPHDCKKHGCESNNDWIFQIMIWKLASKIRLNVVSQHLGLDNKSVPEILEGFAEDARRSVVQVRLRGENGASLSALAWTMAAFGTEQPAVGFTDCVQLLMCNVLGAMFPHGDNRIVFAALYPVPLQQVITPVTWDWRLTTDKLERCVVMHTARLSPMFCLRIACYGILCYIVYQVCCLVFSPLIALF